LSKESIMALLDAHGDLLKRFGVRRIALFGSWASGTAGPDSDIDLLVEFEAPTYENFSGLSDVLEELLGRKVDILTPDGLDAIRVKSVADAIRHSLHDG